MLALCVSSRTDQDIQTYTIAVINALFLKAPEERRQVRTLDSSSSSSRLACFSLALSNVLVALAPSSWLCALIINELPAASHRLPPLHICQNAALEWLNTLKKILKSLHLFVNTAVTLAHLVVCLLSFFCFFLFLTLFPRHARPQRASLMSTLWTS